MDKKCALLSKTRTFLSDPKLLKSSVYCPAKNRVNNISVRISKGLLYNYILIIITLFKNYNILEMISFSNNVK